MIGANESRRKLAEDAAGSTCNSRESVVCASRRIVVCPDTFDGKDAMKTVSWLALRLTNAVEVLYQDCPALTSCERISTSIWIRALMLFESGRRPLLE